ncbi:MAG: TlpA family protein disulfide reductase, partial [Deltaproteobacteria bacterium]|nr:TlpA family protein disulfide reductase [Deltaproteobacteria bacterium]
MSKKHRPHIVGAVLLITGVVFAYYLSDCQTMSVKKALFPGNQVPDFALKDQEGKNCRLYDFKEKVIVLHFWASWCPPCLEELPAMLNFINNYKTNDTSMKLQWVFIEYDQKWDDAWKVIPNKKYPSQVTLLLDPTNSVAARFGIYK